MRCQGHDGPAAVSVFQELDRAPRSWAEQAYPNPIYFNEAGQRQPLLAWKEPDVFTTEIRASFRSLR